MLKHHKTAVTAIIAVCLMLILLKKVVAGSDSQELRSSPFVCFELIADFHMPVTSPAPASTPDHECPSASANKVPRWISVLLCP